MERDINNSTPIEQQLKAIQMDAHERLMAKTAFEGTDQYAAKIGLLMLWVSDDVLEAVDMDLSPFGISESKLGLLLLFMLHDSNTILSPSEIADKLSITRASVTGLLDWVEKRGWIVRRHDTKDRRMLQVEITEAGREIAAHVLPTFWASCASLVEDLTDAERQVLEKLLTKMKLSMRLRKEIEK